MGTIIVVVAVVIVGCLVWVGVAYIAFSPGKEPLKYGTKVHFVHGTYRDMDGVISGEKRGGEYLVDVKGDDGWKVSAWVSEYDFKVKGE